ncbi:unnamed protein product [Moneuplotes crassus]|uniref:EamA domain-containing protein n=1 Tax=Euplotes crassus TaxID=5936 RepID=A0AAD1XGH9_EUPCR|nr:unnamed protein product [Moneuplotes crassus]
MKSCCSSEHNLVHNQSDDAHSIPLLNHRLNLSKEGSQKSDLQDQNNNAAFDSPRNFVFGCIWLFTCVFTCAIIGPMVLAIPCKGAYVSTTWRTQGAIFSIGIYLVYHYCSLDSVNISNKNEGNQNEASKLKAIKTDFSITNQGKSAVMAALLFVWVFGFIVGCKYTLASHADVLYSSCGVYLLIISVMACQYVHKYEFIGYFIYSIGVLIMVTDPFALKKDESQNKAFGDIIAFTTSLGGALYGIFNEKVRRDTPFQVEMFQLFCFQFIFETILIPLFDFNPKYFSFDRQYGMFGWLNDYWIYLIVLSVSFITNILWLTSLKQSYKHWKIEIVAIAFLIEPFIAQATAIIFGQDQIPGFQTLIGISIIILGILLTIYGTKLKVSMAQDGQQNKDSIEINLSEMERLDKNNKSDL